jgi:hypothetical protein
MTELLFIGIGGQEMIILTVVFAPVIFTFYKILTNKSIPAGRKALWIFAILLFNLIGCIFYWWFEKSSSESE